jgi:hypothetical protein
MITLSKGVAMLGMPSLQPKALSDSYVREIGRKIKLIFDKWYDFL